MRRTLALTTFLAVFLTACAAAPIPTTSAGVRLDACGSPVITVAVQEIPAGPEPWRASTTTTVFKPCPKEPPHASPQRTRPDAQP